MSATHLTHSTTFSMDPHDRQRIQQIAGMWKLTPATLAQKLSDGAWIAAPWLKFAAAKIARAIAKGHGRIILSAPPRHGKSELVSVYTPTWVLENFPRRNVMLTGYGADLVEGFGRRVRDLIVEKHKEGFLNVDVPLKTSKIDAFQSTFNGNMYSIGLGGAMTGRGAHVLLVDDYIKEIKEALSPAYRAYCWNWFVTTAMTRLEPGATVIIIATRWHSDDLIGRLIANYSDEWEIITLPGFAEEHDLLGRAVGEPLFPERYDSEALLKQKELLGGVFFQALYQQRPIDEAHKLTNVDWIKPLEDLKTLGAFDWKLCRVWDMAATEGGGDFTTGSLGAYSRSLNKFVLCHVYRGQISSKDAEKKARELAAEDGLDTLICVEQEPGASGKALVNHYQTVVLPEFQVEPVPAVRTKVVRAQPFLAAAEAGNVYALQGSWHIDFLAEFGTFPTGQFDDQVDTVSACYARLSGKKIFSASWGRKSPQDKSNTKAIRQASFRLGNSSRAGVSRVTFGRR